ncbi:MAG TPA: hypothetical protein VG871_02215 [Vicinamibacterales bacterium]|nr:hypothetical protein [Vicinamibacterales bacterium]
MALRGPGGSASGGARPTYWVVSVLLVVASCSAPRLQPADAQQMIVAHPRFTAPERLRLPERYCDARPGTTPPPLAPTDPAYTPPQDVNHVHALEGAHVITVVHRPAAARECRGSNRDLFTVTLTKAGEGFHPDAIDNGWEFILARRKFVRIEGVTYDDPESPKIAHVQYVWTWEPTLLGQILQIGSVPQGASATFLRNGNGWIVRQPGM